MQKLLEDNPAFDSALKLWMRCPKCNGLEIDHEGPAGPWQGCYPCKLFLNDDGHTSKMTWRRE